WDDTVLGVLLWFVPDKSVTEMLLTNYLECEPESAFFRLHLRLQAYLTSFSAEGVATVQSLLARTIDRLLGWETLRDQVSALGTHDPGAVSFAEAAFRHLSSSVVPWKNISGMVLCVFADHSVTQEDD